MTRRYPLALSPRAQAREDERQRVRNAEAEVQALALAALRAPKPPKAPMEIPASEQAAIASLMQAPKAPPRLPFTVLPPPVRTTSNKTP